MAFYIKVETGATQYAKDAALLRAEIFRAIIREREFQTDKYGLVLQPTHNLEGLPEMSVDGAVQGPGGHELAGWLLVIKKELREAEEAATGGGLRQRTGRHSTRAELVQIAATCVAALEQHGLHQETPLDVLVRLGPKPSSGPVDGWERK